MMTYNIVCIFNLMLYAIIIHEYIIMITKIYQMMTKMVAKNIP